MTNVNNIRDYFFKGVLWIKLWINRVLGTVGCTLQEKEKEKDIEKVKE